MSARKLLIPSAILVAVLGGCSKPAPLSFAAEIREFAQEYEVCHPTGKLKDSVPSACGEKTYAVRRPRILKLLASDKANIKVVISEIERSQNDEVQVGLMFLISDAYGYATYKQLLPSRKYLKHYSLAVLLFQLQDELDSKEFEALSAEYIATSKDSGALGPCLGLDSKRRPRPNFPKKIYEARLRKELRSTPLDKAMIHQIGFLPARKGTLTKEYVSQILKEERTEANRKTVDEVLEKIKNTQVF